MKRYIFFVLALAYGRGRAAAQTQNAPLFPVNAKYVQGVGLATRPTAGSGLTLKCWGNRLLQWLGGDLRRHHALTMSRR